jgi:hypothetical protein
MSADRLIPTVSLETIDKIPGPTNYTGLSVYAQQFEFGRQAALHAFFKKRIDREFGAGYETAIKGTLGFVYEALHLEIKDAKGWISDLTMPPLVTEDGIERYLLSKKEADPPYEPSHLIEDFKSHQTELWRAVNMDSQTHCYNPALTDQSRFLAAFMCETLEQAVWDSRLETT